ncbi:hypothetical protein [Geodermatophilus sp. CPCC 205506]
MRSGLNTAAPQASRSRGLLYGGVVVAGVAAAAVVLGSTGGDADPSATAQPPPTSTLPDAFPMPAEAGADDPAPQPLPPPSGPHWSISPDAVPIGGSWTFHGSGFRPGEIVELQASGAVLGIDQADGLGVVQYRSDPVDAEQCDWSPLVVDVVRSSPDADEGESLGTASVRLCSP